VRVIEEQMMKCKKCKGVTRHYRNNTESSGFMLLVHLVLTLATFGMWLALVVIWKILNTKVGGWRCSKCD